METADPSNSLTIPFNLPEDVKKWTEDHVATFLTENNGVYMLNNKHIEVVKKQEVGGLSLLDLKAEDFERWGIPGGPANIIVQLVNKLKVSKGVVEPGKSDSDYVFSAAAMKCLTPELICYSNFIVSDWTKKARRRR